MPNMNHRSDKLQTTRGQSQAGRRRGARRPPTAPPRPAPFLGRPGAPELALRGLSAAAGSARAPLGAPQLQLGAAETQVLRLQHPRRLLCACDSERRGDHGCRALLADWLGCPAGSRDDEVGPGRIGRECALASTSGSVLEFIAAVPRRPGGHRAPRSPPASSAPPRPPARPFPAA